ncbi:MAG: response regulator transcription factor [Bordetella sp.]|nr:response regulator transcription factor [Bordetella sp.]
MHTVLIIDDHPVTTFAVRMLLEQDGLDVVGEAGNGIEGVRMARQLSPEIAIVDLDLPRLDGLEVVLRLGGLPCPPRTLVLTAHAPEVFARRSLGAGAAGFVSKRDGLADVLNAVHALINGYSYFPESTIARTRGGAPDSDLALLAQLSNRELAVLKHLAVGRSNKEIADAMFLSNKTISTYKTRLCRKLGAQSLVELLDFVQRTRLV